MPAAPEFDPVAEMRQLAARLAQAHEAEPSNAPVARELRMTLAELMPKGKPEQDADLTGLFGALQA
jgi:cytochrome c-type biogenesis protein CcmH/NrfF